MKEATVQKDERQCSSGEDGKAWVLVQKAWVLMPKAWVFAPKAWALALKAWALAMKALALALKRWAGIERRVVPLHPPPPSV